MPVAQTVASTIYIEIDAKGIVLYHLERQLF